MTGSGTQADPFIIYDVVDLQAMQNNLSAWYELANDIDASATLGWNAGAGFAPVGALATPFTGNFDGKGFKITSLYISRPTTNNIGLFGVTKDAIISNVGLDAVDISGHSSLGALIGEDKSGTYIDNCWSTGIIGGSSLGGRVGGLVGFVSSLDLRGTIINSHSGASVTGGHSVGGLVGGTSSRGVYIKRSYATGSVSGTNYVGGLIGLTSVE